MAFATPENAVAIIRAELEKIPFLANESARAYQTAYVKGMVRLAGRLGLLDPAEARNYVMWAVAAEWGTLPEGWEL